MTKTDTHKKAMIEALEKSLGIVSIACKAVGIARQTHYEWFNEDPKYKASVEAVAEIALDFAESKLHKQIEKEDTIATIFYLKTKGKKRGYIEKSEIGFTDKDGKDIQPINFILDERYKSDPNNTSIPT